MIITITSLKDFLEFTETFVKNKAKAPQLFLFSSLTNSNDLLETCTALLENMKAKMRPRKRDYNDVLIAIAWPWKWNDIAQTLETIERQKTLILLAMQGDV